MNEEILKAYEQGVQDERVRWKVSLKEVFRQYDTKDWKKQINKIYKED